MKKLLVFLGELLIAILFALTVLFVLFKYYTNEEETEAEKYGRQRAIEIQQLKEQQR